MLVTVQHFYMLQLVSILTPPFIVLSYRTTVA